MTYSTALRIYPDHVLREQSLPVNEISKSISTLVDGMVDLMLEHNGIGLAAPQVGVLKRIIVIRDQDALLPLINPEIKQRVDKHQLEEGCLSLPGIEVNVTRNYSIHVHALQVSGNPLDMDIEGIPARIIQHEVDHLNGVLIIDHATTVERYHLKKQLQQLTRMYQT